MLSEKNRAFIESVAEKIQDYVELREYNRYDYVRYVKFLINLGAKFRKTEENYTLDDVISLSFLKGDISSIEELYNNQENKNVIATMKGEEARILFHESWHFLINKMRSSNSIIKKGVPVFDSPISNDIDEIEANFYARAMYLPERHFRIDVVENVNSDGICDIYAIADAYKADYSDVIDRGIELNLWKQ